MSGVELEPLSERLRARAPEIEQAILTRVYSVSDPTEVRDPEYVEGLRQAVSVAVAYWVDSLCAGERSTLPVPTELLAQARHAADSGVSLDTVLRRYVAGHSLLADFLMQEALESKTERTEQRRLTRVQAALFDRIVDAIAAEHRREVEQRSRSSGARRAEIVQQLLAGELLEAPDLDYELRTRHLGAIAAGPDRDQALRDLAAAFDCRTLLVPHAGRTTWAWFGSRRELDLNEFLPFATSTWPERASLALGEPHRGLSGWRLTHRQALAALPIARRVPGEVTRYGDVALLASILQDEVLVHSLQQLYLEPLAAERDGGEALRETLHAYFAAERNVSSTASAMGVSRKTVSSRLQAIELHLERPLSSCSAELEAALRLMEIGAFTSVPRVMPPGR